MRRRRCARIVSITSRSSMQAMTRSVPPQAAQRSMSRPLTRRRRCDHHKLPLAQPAPDDRERLRGTLEQLSVFAPDALVVASQWAQQRQMGQRPDSLGPGQLGQHPQAQPAQTADLDEVAAARTHRIAIDPPRGGLRPPASLDLVQPDQISTGPSPIKRSITRASSRRLPCSADQCARLSTRW